MGNGYTREKILELVDLTEEYMLRGYTTPTRIVKLTPFKSAGVGPVMARSLMDHVRTRWKRGASRQDRDRKKAQIVEQHYHALREAYQLFAEAKQSVGPHALGEANRALNTIRALLNQIADLEGLKEKTVRVGGTTDGVPVRVEEEHRHIMQLEDALNSGSINAGTYDELKIAILRSRTGDGESGSGSLRMVDATTESLPAPQGDYRGGPAEDLE